MVIGMIMGGSLDDSIEKLRKHCVYAMKEGNNFVMFIDKTAPDFKTKFTHKDDFPVDTIF